MTTRDAHADEDLFAIARKDGKHYLYAPLRRYVAVVNAEAVDVVARYLKFGVTGLSAEETAIIKALKESGLFSGSAPKPPVFPGDFEFRPHEVTLFLTSRCNLRCRYCYADAGHKTVEMPWEIAKAAIDLVSTNAGLLGSHRFGVGFHGGGEPTVAWNLLVRCVEYAHEKAESMGLDAEVYAATNGLITRAQREFIRGHFTSINVSLDGPEDIQDYNRPRLGGAGSYKEVCETLKYFGESGVHFGVRATITAETVHRMTEIVEALHAEFKLAYLHMEPVWECGRCVTSGEKPPTHDDFVRSFLNAAKRGRELGLDIIYSGARLDTLTSKFCAAPGDGYTVLPEGIVTSCFEITEAADPRAEVFHYGHFSAETKSFVFDEARIASLSKLSVENIPFCSDCFCKWHCAGDCLAKVFNRSGSTIHNGSPRCQLNRDLTLASLDDLVEVDRPASTSGR